MGYFHLPPLYFYPLAAGLVLPITFVLTYMISVSLEHTELDWPYISDTATRPPESCVFSQIVNVGALLLAISFYIRFRQVSEYCTCYQIQGHYKLVNNVSLVLGWLGALGLSILCNFQETEVAEVHKVGLYLCFGCGVLWLWCLVYLSGGLYLVFSSHLSLTIRVILSVINTTSFVVMLISGEIARSKFHGQDPTKWQPDDGGWNFHVASTVSEWVMALSLDLSILTLVPEFKLLTFAEPKIIVNVERRGFMNIDTDQQRQEDISTDYFSQSNSSHSLLA